MVTMTYDGSSVYGYVNGVLEASASSTGSGSSGAPVCNGPTIGYQLNTTGGSGGWRFGGSVGAWASAIFDDASFFSRALKPSEVSNLYAGNWPGNSNSVDFQVDNLYFTYPANGTTTPQFSNWQMSARNVTSTNSYQVQVGWGLTQPNQATSTVNASGSQLLSGVSVPKQLFSGDYSDTGDPVGIIASATLTDITSGSVLISSTTVSFNEKTIPASSNCSASFVQCIAYAYDANGNITKVVDNSATNAAITVNYAYDGLNRLISASSSNATSGVNYYQAYTYDPVGNMLSGPAGTYTYGGTGTPDPDAVTSITSGASTTVFTYDGDGNLANASGGPAYAWDYNNRLLTVSSTNGMSTYGYDYTGQRMTALNSGVTTYYPETTYNVNGTTRTKTIFAGGTVVATITNSTSTTGGASLVQQATGSASSGTSVGVTLGAAPKAATSSY